MSKEVDVLWHSEISFYKKTLSGLSVEQNHERMFLPSGLITDTITIHTDYRVHTDEAHFLHLKQAASTCAEK